ncbi:hypothetical protein [Phormidesmis sp. 146-33]
MTTNQPSRLDRIESSLEQLAQRQEITQSQLEQLTQRQETTRFQLEQLTQRQEITRSQIDSQVSVVAELRTTAKLLLQVVNQHQQNFEVITAEIREIRGEIRGLQTENRRILDRLEQHFSDGHGGQ